MKYLITGGAGFIGAHIAKKLAERGDEVVIVDNFNDYYDPQLKEDRIKHLLRGVDFVLHRADITDYAAMEKVFAEHTFDAVCHQAAQPGVRYSLTNPDVYTKINITGTFNLLELSRNYDVDNFVFASSSSVYGENKEMPYSENHKIDKPASFYGATKASAELLARTYYSLHNMNITALRYFTVYGPWGRPDMAPHKFTKNILEGKPIEVYGEGDMERDFTYIDDIVTGIVKALDKQYAWEIINLGFGKPVKLEDFIGTIEKHAEKSAKKEYKPMQPGDMKATYADTTKAQKLLDWNPQTSIDEGMRNFVEWYREYYGRS